MNIWIEIINRQWVHRNHEVFGSLARRQIRKAVSKLRSE